MMALPTGRGVSIKARFIHGFPILLVVPPLDTTKLGLLTILGDNLPDIEV
jgi:hypothetical protein